MPRGVQAEIKVTKKALENLQGTEAHARLQALQNELSSTYGKEEKSRVRLRIMDLAFSFCKTSLATTYGKGEKSRVRSRIVSFD